MVVTKLHLFINNIVIAPATVKLLFKSKPQTHAYKANYTNYNIDIFNYPYMCAYAALLPRAPIKILRKSPHYSAEPLCITEWLLFFVPCPG